jgi:hypothetical protein
MSESDFEKNAAFIDAVEASLGSLVPKDMYALARRGAEMQTYTDDKRAYSAFANSKNASDPECTCCGGTGITYQTERRCACQPLPPPPAGETNE